VRMLTMLVELEPHFRRSSQQQLLLETLLVRFALLDRTMDLEAVLKGMPGGGSGSGPAFGGGAPRNEPMRAAPSAPPASRDAAPRSGPPLMRDSAEPTPHAAPHAAAHAAAHEAPPSRGTPRPAAPSAAVAADVPAAPVALMPAEINRLAEHWEEIVDAVRRSGRGSLASMLDHATPQAVAGNGTVTLAVDSEAHGEALTQAQEHVVAALRTRFSGIERLAVKALHAAPMERLTEASVRERKVAQLRKRDPLLDAAIDALDLRLLD